MTRLEMFELVIGYNSHFNAIDAETVAEEACKKCGLTKKYYGFRKGNSYRAFAVCEPCDTAEEF